MINHLKPKSLAFYGIAISLVLLLFNRVTAYGNANLKAPAQIEGRYLLKAQKLPPCLQTRPLVLTLEQSGTYIAGLLTTGNGQPVATTEEKPGLSGRFGKTGNITLVGSAQDELCSAQSQQLKIIGTIRQSRFDGQIQVGAGNQWSRFTAQRQAVAKQDKAAH